MLLYDAYEGATPLYAFGEPQLAIMAGGYGAAAQLWEAALGVGEYLGYRFVPMRCPVATVAEGVCSNPEL